jgi:gluconate transporter
MTTELYLLVLVASIVLLLFLTIVVKLHPFVALVTTTAFVGFATGMGPDQLLKSIEGGIGGFLGMLAPILVLGAIVGKMMEISGGAERLARTLIRLLGRRNTHWAMMIVGYICGIPVFFQVGIVLLMPLLFSVARAAGMSLVMVGIPMIIGLFTVHCVVPPHPAATAVAIALHADLGKVILYGLIVGLPAAAVAGPIFGKMIGEKFTLQPPEHLKKIAELPDDQLPPLGVTLLTILCPLILMIAKTALEMLLGPKHAIMPVVGFLGQPIVALFIAAFVSYWTLGLARGRDMKSLAEFSEKAIGPMAAILVIIGASGAFNKVLMDSGIGAALKIVLTAWQIDPYLLSWATALIMHIAIGGATIAMLTTVGLILPILPLYPHVDMALIAVAIGIGTIGFSHVNDPGFWFVKEYFGLSMNDMFKSYTASTIIAAFVGLAVLMAFRFLIGA